MVICEVTMCSFTAGRIMIISAVCCQHPIDQRVGGYPAQLRQFHLRNVTSELNGDGRSAGALALLKTFPKRLYAVEK
jgi:hypothetical protein